MIENENPKFGCEIKSAAKCKEQKTLLIKNNNKK